MISTFLCNRISKGFNGRIIISTYFVATVVVSLFLFLPSRYDIHFFGFVLSTIVIVTSSFQLFNVIPSHIVGFFYSFLLLAWPVGLALIEDREQIHITGIILWGLISIILVGEVRIVVMFFTMALIVSVSICSAWQSKSVQVLYLHIIPSSPLLLVVVWMYLKSGTSLKTRIKELETCISYLNGKAEYVDTLAHEVRTPLNALINCCCLLKDTSLGSEQLQYMGIITSCASQISSNVEFVLELCRLEDGKVILDNKPFRPSLLCQECLDMCKAAAQSKRLELTLDVGDDSILIGDSGRLRQVILNLLSNAIKFTPSGSVELRSHADPRSQLLTVEFSYTGPGIPAKDAERLFQPFQQLSADVWTRYGGSGLGLVICRRLLALMGGSIWIVQDNPDQQRGTCIRMQIPLMSPSPEEGSIYERFLSSHCTNPSSSEISAVSRGSAWPLLRTSSTSNFDTYPSSSENVGTIVYDVDQIIEPHHNQQHHQQQQTQQQPTNHEGSPPPNVLMPDVTENIVSIPDFKYKSVMVVDDNTINAAIMASVLKTIGFRDVITANSGEEAVKLFSEHPNVHVVFMDICMSGIDGVEAAKQMRNLENIHGSHPYIIAMSGSGDRDIKRRCLSSGIDEFVIKPVTREYLTEQMTKWANLNKSLISFNSLITEDANERHKASRKIHNPLCRTPSLAFI